MLRHRLVFGVLMGAAVIGLLALDAHLASAGITGASPAVLCLALLASPPAGREFFTIAAITGARPFRRLGTLLIAGVLAAMWWIGWTTAGPEGRPLTGSEVTTVGLCSAGALASVFFAAGLRGAPDGAVSSIAATVLGVIYLGGLGGFFLLFRFESGSVWCVLAFLLIVKSTDIGAYHFGKTLGRHKLIAWLSPGKTWEGTVGGLATATTVAGIIGLVRGGEGWLPLGWSVLFGLAVAVTGQLGDLAKSLLKRDAGVKDSGASIPGFGGVLDVIDSPLLASPVAWALWRWMA